MLFPNDRAIRLDLASLNIQRGRDHGFPDYNTFRHYYGLEPYTNFSQITTNTRAITQLTNTYGDINKIDVFIGIIAEDPLPGGIVGELGAAIIKHTMSKIRSGDRFWYENSLPQIILDEVKGTTFADLIRRNTEINNIPDDVFIVPPTVAP